MFVYLRSGLKMQYIRLLIIWYEINKFKKVNKSLFWVVNVNALFLIFKLFSPDSHSYTTCPFTDSQRLMCMFYMTFFSRIVQLMKHMNGPVSITSWETEVRNLSETQLITKKENISTLWLGKTNKYGMKTYQRGKGEAESLVAKMERFSMSTSALFITQKVSRSGGYGWVFKWRAIKVVCQNLRSVNQGEDVCLLACTWLPSNEPAKAATAGP